jgi:hypothetical protein
MDRDKARPDYHDPTAGIGGAAPALSALTLRLVLASLGLVGFAALAVWVAVGDGPVVLVVVCAVVALGALVNLVVVARRKLRGEPG